MKTLCSLLFEATEQTFIIKKATADVDCLISCSAATPCKTCCSSPQAMLHPSEPFSKKTL